MYACIYIYIYSMYIFIPLGEGKGYPLQYSGLENSMDCIVHGVAESDTTERLSLHFTSYIYMYI